MRNRRIGRNELAAIRACSGYVEAQRDYFVSELGVPAQKCVTVYTGADNTVFYTGVTDGLVKRAYQHKNKLAEGFTKKYKITQLVYYELYQYVWDDAKGKLVKYKPDGKGAESKKSSENSDFLAENEEA